MPLSKQICLHKLTIYVSVFSFIDDNRNLSFLVKITVKQPIPFTDIVYNLTIKTGDKLNAGTDANVFFSLHGDKGETPRIGLQDESQTFGRFERSRADKFVVQTSDVGKVTQSLLCMCYAWIEKQEFTYPGCQSFGFFGYIWSGLVMKADAKRWEAGFQIALR